MRTLTPRERSRIWRYWVLPDGRRIILTEYPAVGEEQTSDEVNRNMFCVDDDSRVFWQVDAPPPRGSLGDPFVHVVIKDEAVTATRYFGDICEVDLMTGAATIVAWTK